MITVIVPTVGRAESLALLVADLHSSPVPVARVIVVADGAPESALRAIERIGGIELIALPERRGAAAARNAAAATVGDGLLCFLDDDVRLAETWSAAMAAAVAAGWECFTGPVTSTERSALAESREDRYRRRYANLGWGDPVSFLAGGNSSVSVRLFRQAGGFPLVRVGSDTAILAAVEAAGDRCRFATGLLVTHRHNRGWRIAFANAWRSGGQATRQSLRGELSSLRRNETRQSRRVRLINLVFLATKGLGRSAAGSRAQPR